MNEYNETQERAGIIYRAIDSILNIIGWLMYITGALMTLLMIFGVVLLWLDDGTCHWELVEVAIYSLAFALLGDALTSRVRHGIDRQDRLIDEAAQMASERLREREGAQ